MIPPRDLHLEITSKCTLSCHACPRTEYKGTYKICDLPLSAIENLVNTSHEFDSVALCGDHGDPIYHKDFFEVIKLLKQLKNKPRIDIYTNGSGRTADWWIKVGKMLDHRDFVRFAIDGLEDTNHLYRKGAKWDSIMTAVDSLDEYSECQKFWHWILFRYNQHQISDGFKLAQSKNFSRFSIVQSFRHDCADEDEMYVPTISLEEARSMCVS